MEQQETPGRIRDIRAYRPSFVGMVLLVCALFLVLAAAPVYGAFATVALAIVWLVLFVVGCRWFGSRPKRVLAVGVVSILCWLGAVALTVALG